MEVGRGEVGYCPVMLSPGQQQTKEEQRKSKRLTSVMCLRVHQFQTLPSEDSVKQGTHCYAPVPPASGLRCILRRRVGEGHTGKTSNADMPGPFGSAKQIVSQETHT